MFIFRNNTCNCDDYVHLELTREQISKRIKEHKKILKNLKKIAISSEMNLLYQCSFCGQYWQESSAWNWGGKTYLFKVPKVDISDWLNEQFASPADILIYSARMNEYFTKNNIKETNKKCKIYRMSG